MKKRPTASALIRQAKPFGADSAERTQTASPPVQIYERHLVRGNERSLTQQTYCLEISNINGAKLKPLLRLSSILGLKRTV